MVWWLKTNDTSTIWLVLLVISHSEENNTWMQMVGILAVMIVEDFHSWFARSPHHHASLSLYVAFIIYDELLRSSLLCPSSSNQGQPSSSQTFDHQAISMTSLSQNQLKMNSAAGAYLTRWIVLISSTLSFRVLRVFSDITNTMQIADYLTTAESDDGD
jgi:hypothetical protein